MPKMPHEALVRLVHAAPSMIPRLLWPERQVSTSIHVGPAEITDLHLAEYRADAVLLLGDDSRRPDKAIIVEAQTDIDRDKEWTWPFYLSGLWVRLRCPTVLVVVAVDREVLQQRGFEITDVERQRILECGDLDRLQVWLGRVLTAKTLAEVFGD